METPTEMQLAVQRKDLARQSLDSAEQEVFAVMVSVAKAMRVAGFTSMWNENPMRNLAWQVASGETKEST